MTDWRRFSNPVQRYPEMLFLPGLTDAQSFAMWLAVKEGYVYAGKNMTSSGQVVQVSASTLRSLERRGGLVTQISPDGGMMATPTQQGRDAVAGKEEAQLIVVK